MFPKIVAIFALLLIACNAALSNQNPTDERDIKFRDHLLQVMSNYTSWLAKSDPLTVPGTVQLAAFKIGGNVDVTLELSNQVMADHSKTKSDIFRTSSLLNETSFQVSRGTTQELITFSGDYSITSGFYYGPTGTDPPRSIAGQGRWTLKTNSISESMIFQNFTVTYEGFIDLSDATQRWDYIAWAWPTIEVPGLVVASGTEDDREAVRKALAELYAMFLRANIVNAQTIRGYIPPLKLFLEFMGGTLEKTKMEDIVGEWERPTTTTPKGSDPPPSKAPNLETIPLLIILNMVIFTIVSFKKQ